MSADAQAAANVVPLFDVDELAAVQPQTAMGRVEAALIKALKAAATAGELQERDLGLVGSALAGARAIDNADRWPSLKSGYLIAQLLTPYRETLAGLRLPAALAPAEPDGLPAGDRQGELPDWMRDQLGTPE